jgi:hypothetical protein
MLEIGCVYEKILHAWSTTAAAAAVVDAAATAEVIATRTAYAAIVKQDCSLPALIALHMLLLSVCCSLSYI